MSQMNPFSGKLLLSGCFIRPTKMKLENIKMLPICRLNSGVIANASFSCSALVLSLGCLSEPHSSDASLALCMHKVCRRWSTQVNKWIYKCFSKVQRFVYAEHHEENNWILQDLEGTKGRGLCFQRHLTRTLIKGL